MVIFSQLLLLLVAIFTVYIMFIMFYRCCASILPANAQAEKVNNS